MEGFAVRVEPVLKRRGELKMRPIWKSITFKWMVFSILLATVPLSISGYRIIQIYQKNEKKSIVEFQKEKVILVVERTRGFMEKITDILFDLANEDQNWSSLSNAKEQLKKLLNQRDYFSELSLLDEKGWETVRVSKQGQSDLRNRSDSEMFKITSMGGIYYGDFYFPPDGVLTIGVAIPVQDYAGKRVGVLSARVQLRYLSELMKQTKIGEKGCAYVVDREGFLIAQPEGVNIQLGPFVDRVIAGEEGSLEFENLRGQKYLVVYKPIPELKWGVVVQVPVGEAYEPIKEITRTAIKWIIISFILAFAFSLFLTKRLISPIKKLSGEMAKVSKGDLDVHIKPSTKDEVGYLTRSFNQMIQDLKESQESIKKAEEKYRNIFESSKDMVYITSVDGEFIDVNQAGVEMLGYTHKEELMNTPVKNLYFYAVERFKFQQEVSQRGFVKDFEVKLKKRDGTPLDCLITGSVRRDRDGKIIGYEGTIKDITYRKRIEEELYQRTKELETLYDLSVLINQTLDLDQVLPMALERVIALTGFEMGTIYLLNEGKEWLELRYHKNYPSHLEEAVKRLKRGEGVAGTAVEKKEVIILSINQYPSSHILPHLLEEKVKALVGIPLFSKGEAIGAICLTSRSERLLHQNEIHLLKSLGNQIGMTIKNARLVEEIKESEKRYRTVVEGAHEGICVIGMDNRFRYLNAKMGEMMGIPVEKLIGRDFRETLTEASQEIMADRYLRWAKGETLSPSFELEILKGGSEVRQVEINVQIIKDDQGNANYICFVKDITDHKKMEEQLLQTEKLRALGEMASGVAHDFNNALAAILGNTQLLLHTVKEEEVREPLKTIEKVAKDSAQTVKRLQDFTRKRVRQELFKLDVNAIIQDVVEITRPKWKDEAQRKGLQFEIHTHLEEVSKVPGNASEMREVMTNLLLNALEAMPQGGQIKIHTFEKDHWVYIQVTDTGIGMDETTRQKVFEPFFTTKPFSNTGLGLSVSYGIIRRFGGEIKVESQRGSGTTFTILLPVTQGDNHQAERVSSSQPPHPQRPLHILVIDDEETVRSVLTRMLTQIHHQVTVAKDGTEGIRLFQQDKFDLVLTDLGMPGVSGWEVCESIKRMSPSIPVGMITGWGLEVDEKRKKAAGLDFIITKPFDFNQIIQVVSEKIKNRPASVNSP